MGMSTYSDEPKSFEEIGEQMEAAEATAEVETTTEAEVEEAPETEENTGYEVEE